jgi:sugar/nucleoside kinase (ribokinase family)
MNDTVVCLGELMLESSVHLQSLPSPNTTIMVDGVRRRLGGPTLNIALHLASLRKNVFLVGVAGKWDEGALRYATSKAHVSLDHMVWSDKSSDVLFYFKTSTEYRAVYQKADSPTNLRNSFLAAARGGSVIVLAGGRHEDIRTVYLEAVSIGGTRKIVFAPNYSLYAYSKEELRVLLPRAHVVCLNDNEKAHIIECLGLGSVQALREFVRDILIVTKGEDGAEIHAQRQVYSFRALSGQRGDFIGAGDAFLSGFLHALLSGVPVDAAGMYASRAAAAFIKADDESPVLSEDLINDVVVSSEAI